MNSLSNTGNFQLDSNGLRMSNQNGNCNNNANNNNNNGQSNANLDLRQTYTIPGIVQFLQYEWQRFELYRQQWEVEKSELQARIALLQGERKGQENLKNDLIRRIKMLEYCLREERVKYHMLKYGVEPPEHKENEDELNMLNFGIDKNNVNDGGDNLVNWKQGRQLLRHYLKEIGYTDTIIDVRSNRVRSLMGLSSNYNEEYSSEQTANKVVNQAQNARFRKQEKESLKMMANDTESSVLATFDFLHSQSDNGLMEGIEDEEDVIDNEAASEEVLNEFDMFLNTRIDLNDNNIANWKGGSVAKDVDIGELASLTEPSNVIDCATTVNNEVRKTWNQKYILKSHYDCIRTLRFHSTEPLLITASEDETLKLWNLNKTLPPKNKQINSANATIDLDPVHTYRGHTCRVLSLCTNGNKLYSGSQDGQIIQWQIPSNVMNIDAFDAYDPKLQVSNAPAHTDSVWSLVSLTSANNSSQLLCSGSSDGSIKIWDVKTTFSCVKTLQFENGIISTDLFVVGSPNMSTSMSSSATLVSSFNDGGMALFDIETANTSPLLSFEKQGVGMINSITMHPTMPVVITAHQDRHIRFWDISTGKCIHSMVAHLEEVTSVDCDPNGLYILSGSHDCSVRLWNFDNKNCVQEITSHRKKFDESIFDVSFHPSKPYFASAGADALAKVFV